MTLTHPPGTLRMTPARRAALAIGVPVALMMIGCLGFVAVSNIGGASIPLSIPSLPVQHGHLSVDLGSGNVTVRQGQPGAARLVGTIRYSLVRPDITRTSDGVSVHCRLVVGNCRLEDATMTVPPHTGLTLSSGGGDQTVSGVDSGVNLSSGGGNVVVTGVGGRVSVLTGGGDLTAQDLAGALSFTTNGGNINGTALASTDVRIRSYGGNVTLTFTKPPTYLDIHSSGGNITVALPQIRTGYNLITTSDGGNVHQPRNIINSSATNTISLDSGGGDISVSYAS